MFAPHQTEVDTGNQSEFVNTQAVLQAPPEVLAQHAQQEAGQLKGRSRKKLLVMVGVGFLLFLIVGFLYRAFFYRPTQPVVTALPSPPPVAEEQTALEQQLETVADGIEEANPHIYSFPPPPVDMNISF